MLKFKLYLNLVLSIMLVVGSLPALALSPTTSALVQKNYLANGGFESGPVGFKTYKNAAQATPVTGLGGTPATTMTTTTLTPIADKTSALYTHTAANLQGEGVALPFTLEPRAKAKMLTISGAYQIVSGTYSGGSSTTDSDVEVYVYDVDAAQLIQPAVYKLDGGVIGQIYSINATFQSNLASSNYRLILHNATTTTSAFQLKLDDLSVGSQSKTFGTTRGPVGSIISSASGTTPTGYLPANGALVSRTQYSALFLAIGTTYGAGDGSTTFALPNLSGVFARGSGSQTIGGITYSGTLGATSGDAMQGHVHAIGRTLNQITGSYYQNINSGSLNISYQDSTGVPISDGTNGTPRTGSETRPANVSVAYYICFDAGTTSAADSGEGRVVAASGYYTGSAFTPPNNTGVNTTFPFNATSVDTLAAFNPSTSTYVIPVSGVYDVDFMLTYNSTATAGNVQVIIAQNGVSLANSISTPDSSNSNYRANQVRKTIYAKAGDSITFIYVFASITGGIVQNQPGTCYFNIKRLSANSQILAGESVNATYSTTSGQSIANTGTTIVWNSKTFDSHSGMNTATGVYTVQVPGKYLITANAAQTFATAGNQLDLNIYVNGVHTKNARSIVALANQQAVTSITDIEQATAGQQIYVSGFPSVSGNLSTDPSQNTFSIIKVGN